MSCIATCFSSFIWYKTICGGRQNGINDHSVPDFSSNHVNLKGGVKEYKPHQGPLQGIGHYLRGKINVRLPSLCAWHWKVKSVYYFQFFIRSQMIG